MMSHDEAEVLRLGWGPLISASGPVSARWQGERHVVPLLVMLILMTWLSAICGVSPL